MSQLVMSPKTAIFLLICLVPIFGHQQNITQPKIVGGKIVTNRANFPYMVSFRAFNSHFCGGSIITRRHVLSAAHCFYDLKDNPYSFKGVSVVAGSLTLRKDAHTLERSVKSVILFNGYNSTSMDNDIAIVEIFKNFGPWSPYINYIELSNVVNYRGYCNVCGWGVTQFESEMSSNVLRTVNVPIVDQRTCRRYFYGASLTNNMFCAGEAGVDSCQGDSGGPLVCGDVLYGVVSWGSDCGVYPGVYTNVYKYRNWIKLIVSSSGERFGARLFNEIITFTFCLHLFLYFLKKQMYSTK